VVISKVINKTGENKMQRRHFLALIGLAGVTARVMGDPQAPAKRVSVPKRHNVMPPPQKIPLTLVAIEKGRRIYTQLVNTVTCHQFASDIEWVGTGYGVKRIDKKRGEVHLYTMEDGLPGNYIHGIVGDEKEAFALVRREGGSALAFCRLNPSTDCWETLYSPEAKRVSGGGFGFGGQGFGRFGGGFGGSDISAITPAHLAMKQDIVVFARIPFGGGFNAPNAAGNSDKTEQDALYYVYNRRTKVLISMPWDETLRQADMSISEISFCHLRNNKLWLGTNIGLLELPLVKTANPRWCRLLPQYEIVRGAASEQTLFLATMVKRQRESLKTIRFDWATETVADLPEYPKELANRVLYGCTDEVWLTVGETLYRTYRQISSRYAGLHAGPPPGPPPFMVLRPQAKEWEIRDFSGKVISDAKTIASSFAFPPDNLPSVVSPAELPDAAVGALLGMEHWLCERFSRWLSPDHSSEVTPIYKPDYLSGATYNLQKSIYPDPIDPTYVWLIEGNEIVYIPRQDLAKRNPNGLNSSKDAVRFAIDSERTRQSIPVKLILPGETTFVGSQQQNALLRIQEGEVPSSVAFPNQPFMGNLSIGSCFVAGPKKHIFVQENNEKTLRRWDEPSQAFIPTEITMKNRDFGRWLGGTRDSIWRCEGDKIFEFLPIDMKGKPQEDWKVAPIDFLGEAILQFLKIQCDVLWYKKYEQASNSHQILGWDDIHKRAIEPLKVDRDDNFSVLEDDNANIYFFLSGENKSLLYLYRRGENNWKLLSDLSKANIGDKKISVTILAIHENGIWILAKDNLLCFDQKTEHWALLENKPGSPFPMTTPDLVNSTIITPDKHGFVWIGSGYGLWKFNPADRSIVEVMQPAIVAQENPFSDSLHILKVTKESVWGRRGVFLVRLDRETKKARYYGIESGVGRFYLEKACFTDSIAIFFLENSIRSQIYGKVVYSYVKDKDIFNAIPIDLYIESVSENPGNPNSLFVFGSKEVVTRNAFGGPNLRGGALYDFNINTRKLQIVTTPTLSNIINLHTLGNTLYAATPEGLYAWDAPVSDWRRTVPLSVYEFLPDMLSHNVVWASDGVNYIRLQAQTES
jgi:hypothetical protein